MCLFYIGREGRSCEATITLFRLPRRVGHVRSFPLPSTPLFFVLLPFFFFFLLLLLFLFHLLISSPSLHDEQWLQSFWEEERLSDDVENYFVCLAVQQCTLPFPYLIFFLLFWLIFVYLSLSASFPAPLPPPPFFFSLGCVRPSS